MSRLVSSISILIFVLFSTTTFAHDDDNDNGKKPLNIVIIKNNHPFSFSLPDGKPAGLYVDFWKLWSLQNNIPIKFTSESLENGLAIVKKKKGIHAGLFKNANREQWADFGVPIHNVSTGIVYNPAIIDVETLENHEHIIVGVQSGSFQEKFLRKNFPNTKLYLFEGLENGIQQLLHNEVQAVVSEIPNIKAQVARAGLSGVFQISKTPLIKNLVYPLITKNQPQLLALINNGFNNIPRNKLTELETKWLPTLNPYFRKNQFFSSLSAKEEQWLKSSSSFTVGAHTDWYPYEYQSKNEELIGLTSDYLEIAADTLKVKFNIHQQKNWRALLNQLETGKLDIISAIVRTPERIKRLLLTKPYIETPTVIVIRKNSFYVSTINDLHDKRIGLIKGYSLIELVSHDYPDYKIIPVMSLTEGLIKLHNGEIDAFINTATAIKTEIDNLAFDDLEIAAIAPYVFEVSMAVRKGLEPLIPILNRVFENMSGKQKSAIANNWLSVEFKQGTDLKTILTWAIPIISFLLIVIIVFSSINRRLKNEIAQRKKSEEEQRSLELQLHQSQKMEALGQLTSGIAHDFNNLLGIILGYSEMMKSGVIKQEKINTYSEHIFYAASRGAKLTKKLMSFTRMQDIESASIDMNEVLHKQMDLLQKTLTVNITIQYDLKGDIWPVWLDRSDLEDSILNICINAKHAMEKSNRDSVLTISTKNKTLNTSNGMKLGLNPGEYVELCIRDTGCGMTQAVKSRIFDPFYTTKNDKGTGLGLSQVFGFARRSNAAIDVYTDVSSGSQFLLYFPRYVGQSSEVTASLIKKEPTLTGTESILLVDDEPSLLMMSAQILDQAGYHTIQCDNGADALEQLKLESVDLLLSDVIMPEMDGFQLASAVQKQYPNIKIQLVSGYADPKNSTLIDQSLVNNILRKPYSAQALLSTIRSTLDS